MCCQERKGENKGEFDGGNSQRDYYTKYNEKP